jgi:hypothetical protein
MLSIKYPQNKVFPCLDPCSIICAISQIYLCAFQESKVMECKAPQGGCIPQIRVLALHFGNISHSWALGMVVKQEAKVKPNLKNNQDPKV